MDPRILKAILCSSESVNKDLENSEDYNKLIQEETFLPTSSNIFKGLSLSLTNLLSYKVSKEAYQRYAVRLNVINVLRDCCRITDTLKTLRLFADEKRSLTFIETLLEKYLTNDVLDDCDSSDELLPLISALMCLASTNAKYKCHVERLLLKLSQLELSEESERLLCYVVQKNSELNLGLSTIESIYDSQRCKLIEEPLLNHFVSSCTDINKDNNTDKSESVNLTNQLLEFASKSPRIFLLMCAFVKELLVQLDCSSAAVNFTQSILKRVEEYCQEQGKDILDLYPRNLQSTVILLRIEPTHHTDDSRSATLDILKNIHSEDKDIAITLLSHFPEWLKSFGELLLSDLNAI